MVFAFWHEKEDCFIDPYVGEGAIYSHDQFLAYDIGYEVFLGWIDMVGHPEDTDLFEEWEDDLSYGFIDSAGGDIGIEDGFEVFDIHIHHMLDQFVDDAFLLGLGVSDGEDTVADLAGVHFIDMADLVAVFVEQGDVEDGFQFIGAVVTDIGFGPLGFEEVVSLLPYADGMGLDAGEVFKILDGEGVHGCRFCV